MRPRLGSVLQGGIGAVVVVATIGRATGAEPTPSALPPGIVRAADALVAARIGPEHFTRWISSRPDASRFVPPDMACERPEIACSDERRTGYYEIHYSFRIPEKPFVEEIVGVAITPEGLPVSGDPFFGVPGCADSPAACDFELDEASALRIAARAGLAPGLRGIRAEFQWYGGALKRYVWSVSNTLEDEAGHQDGETVVIDAASGGVLSRNTWAGNE